jgi:iron complex outermembrane receptor protein
MGTRRLRSVPLALLRLTIAGTLVLARAIANAAEPIDEIQAEEVVVTGTRLELRKSEGPQEVKVYSREQIDQSGQASVSDFLNTLPDVSVSLTEGAFQSRGGETSVQLHGLPVGTTLVLINGRRVQDSAITLGSAFVSNFFDLNNIPLSAVERIEVVPAGSSAIYGSDAIAGVVNLVLKKQFSGAEADARYSFARNLPQWDADLAYGQQWERSAFTLLGSFETRGTLTGFNRSVTATQNLTAQGGLDTREKYCPTANVYSVNGTNLPGLNAPYAAVPHGFTGTPSIGEFAGTAGTLNKCSLYAYNSFIPTTRRQGIFGQGYFDITDSVQVFAELLGSHVQEDFNYYPFPAFGIPTFQQFKVSSSNPYNPFGRTVGIGGVFAYAPLSYQSGSVFVRPLVGLRGGFASDWQWELTALDSLDRETYTEPNSIPNRPAIQAAFNSSNPATALNPFVDLPFDSPSFDRTVFNSYIQHYTASDVGLNGFARGTLFHLPTGGVRVVIGSSYDRYRLYTDNGNYANFVLGPPGVAATFHRDTYAVFGETRIPIVGNSGNTQEPDKLAATVAVRYDHFNDFGGTTNPQYGAEWRPVRSLLLRGMYGTSFRAPPLYDLYSPVIAQFPNFVSDPEHGNQTVPVTILRGGNPHLQAETGTSHSFGVVYTSAAIPNFQASLTQWRIEESGNIQQLLPQTLVDNPSLFPGSVVRGANGALLQVNDSLFNFGSIVVDGLSCQMEYKYHSSFGVWTPVVSATDTYRYRVALRPNRPAVNAVSQAQDSGDWAPRWKGSTGLGWAFRRLAITATGRYVGNYKDYDSTRDIGNFWYFDLNTRYALVGPSSKSRDIVKNAFLEVGGVNVLNELPRVSRYSAGFVGYDPAQADIRGRFLYVRLGGRF